MFHLPVDPSPCRQDVFCAHVTRINDTDCSRIPSEAVCGTQGLCSCPDGFRQVSNTVCRKLSRLTESCLEDADCQTLVSNTVCTRGECSCASGHWNHNNTECWQVSAVKTYGRCVGDQDCDSSLHLRCVSGTCTWLGRTVGGYEYRLVGGSACNEGNVELRRNGGSWDVVCDDYWETRFSGTSNAKVICRSLGFRSGSPTMEPRYGRSENFYMDDVKCGGSETHLMNCPYKCWGVDDCFVHEVAGVQCNWTEQKLRTLERSTARSDTCGEDFRFYICIPKRTFNLHTTYAIPNWRHLCANHSGGDATTTVNSADIGIRGDNNSQEGPHLCAITARQPLQCASSCPNVPSVHSVCVHMLKAIS